MRNLSFAARLLLVAFVPAMLVAILLSLYFIVHSGRDSEKSEIQQAMTLAQGLSRAAEFGVATHNPVILEQAAQPVLAVPSIFAVRYFSTGKEPLYQVKDKDHQFGEISPLANFARRLLSESPLISQVSANIERTDLTLFEDPLFDSLDSDQSNSMSKIIGRIELDVDLSLAYENQYEIIRRVFTYVVLVLLISLASAFRLAQSVISPVRSLTASVRSLARNHYVKVPPVRIGGELDELASGINFLSSELQSFHARQSEAIRLATADLQSTLTLLEAKNKELDEARKSAETASAFKSQFVANVSHEIRTPLNAIIGTLSVMNKTGLDITQVDQIDMIQNSSNTLLYLIEDILDISKIESGNLVVESIGTNLETLLTEVTRTAAMQAVDQGIELYVSPLPDLSLRNAYTDPLRLKQVLSNLLSNAIKFTHSGHVSLSTDILETRSGYRNVRFTVTDTGIGIPLNKQASLFSAFTQVDMSTTRRYGGTGLGLFICSGIVRLLGGTIHLHSEEGKGTSIEVTLPMTVARNAEPRLPDMNEEDDQIIYMDDYSPLATVNRRWVNAAFGSVLKSEGGKHSGPVCVTNIPNHLLSSHWKAPADLERAKPDSPDTNCTTHIAWISLITPLLRARLEQAGYTGYVIKTPSIIQLKRNIQVALSGQCFQTGSTESQPDNRPGKVAQALTVLAVDDQRINIDLMMQYFDYLNIRGLYALSGEEALACIGREAIDLVLLDLHMPKQDGFQVAERIRASGGINAQVPLIAMTADAYQATREKALAAGFDDLLTKPATVKQVSDTIWNWVERDPATLPDSALIDVRACADAVHGNEEWARGALKTYGSEIPGHVTAMQRALREKDISALFDSAHAVKGVSRLFRIDQVANAAQALEETCTGTDWKLIERSTHELERLLRIAEDECKSLLT